MPKYRIAWLPGEKSLTKEFPVSPLPKSRQAIPDARPSAAEMRSGMVDEAPESFVTRWQRTIGSLTARALI